jgi:hypothetical protein
VRGGVVWGISAALRERSEVDPRFGGFVNPTLEEYPIAVNADVGTIEVDFIDRPDPLLNPVGVKGLGELSMVGVAAAICNAIFHATGQRHRRLPVRIEDLLLLGQGARPPQPRGCRHEPVSVIEPRITSPAGSGRWRLGVLERGTAVVMAVGHV